MGSERARENRFTERVRPLLAALERTCRRLVWERSGWEDALQRALLVAWMRFDTYDERRSFRSWIFSILFHTAFNANRALRRRAAQETRARDESPIAATDPLPLDEDPGPALAEAMGALRPVERAALVMRGIEELKYSEIADAMGIPIGTVMSHLHRARMKVRDALA